MPYRKPIERLARLTKLAASETELFALMEEATSVLGYAYFAITVHGYSGGCIGLSSIPDAWRKNILGRDYWPVSPVADRCASGSAGFAWSEMLTTRRWSRLQRSFFARARRLGVGDGYSIPVRAPGLLPSCVSYITRAPDLAPADSRADAHYFACTAYDSWIRIDRCSAAQAVKLSDRQVACIRLAGQGKSDLQIGDALGISKETAHKHVQFAMRRLNVTCRTQLVARVLSLSILSFSDVLPRECDGLPRP